MEDLSVVICPSDGLIVTLPQTCCDFDLLCGQIRYKLQVNTNTEGRENKAPVINDTHGVGHTLTAVASMSKCRDKNLLQCKYSLARTHALEQQ